MLVDLIDGNVLTGKPRGGQAVAGCRSVVAGRERLAETICITIPGAYQACSRVPQAQM